MLEQKIRDVERIAAQIMVNRAPNFQLAKSLIGPPFPSSGCTMLDQMIGPLHLGTYANDALCQALAARRAATLLLAAQLYAARRGTPPAAAAALVPEILPALPLDPYAANDQPLRYRLDAGIPTVWSVGRNGLDDSSAPLRTGDDLLFGAGHYPATASPPAVASRP